MIQHETEYGLLERVVDVESMKHGTITGILLFPEATTYQIAFGKDVMTFNSEEWRFEAQIARVEATP